MRNPWEEIDQPEREETDKYNVQNGRGQGTDRGRWMSSHDEVSRIAGGFLSSGWSTSMTWFLKCIPSGFEMRHIRNILRKHLKRHFNTPSRTKLLDILDIILRTRGNKMFHPSGWSKIIHNFFHFQKFLCDCLHG